MLIFVVTDIENDPFMPNNETDLYHIRACLKGMRLPCPFHFHLQLTITLAFYFNFPPTNKFSVAMQTENHQQEQAHQEEVANVPEKQVPSKKMSDIQSEAKDVNPEVTSAESDKAQVVSLSDDKAKEEEVQAPSVDQVEAQAEPDSMVEAVAEAMVEADEAEDEQKPTDTEQAVTESKAKDSKDDEVAAEEVKVQSVRGSKKRSFEEMVSKTKELSLTDESRVRSKRMRLNDGTMVEVKSASSKKSQDAKEDVVQEPNQEEAETKQQVIAAEVPASSEPKTVNEPEAENSAADKDADENPQPAQEV